MTDRRLVRRALLGIVLVALALPWIIIASQRVFDDIHNVPYLWVSGDFQPRQIFDDFLERFDRPETIILSYPGCTVDDPRLARLARRLTSSQTTETGHTFGKLFPDVATGYGALQSLQQPPMELSRPAALQRLRGILVGPDGQTSCAVISVSRQGAEMRGQVADIIRNAAARTVGLPADDFVMAGGLLEGVEIDAESSRSSRLVVPSAIVSLVLCIICLRSVWLSLPIFVLSMIGQGLVLAITHYSGIAMNAILLVLAPLVFTLTMSAGVHLANYYREEKAREGAAGAMDRAVRLGWMPCALAALTTAIGLASLAVSEVVPVRQFGTLGAIGCLAAFALLFMTFPGVISYRSPAPVPKRGKKRGKSPRTDNPIRPKKFDARSSAKRSGIDNLESPRLRAIGLFVGRYAYPLTFLVLVLMGVGTGGISRLRTSVDVLSLLPQGSRLVQDFHWLEEHLGPLVPLEFIVQFSSDDDRLLIERLEVLQRVQAALMPLPDVGGTMSALNFLPSLPRSGGIGGTVRRRVFNTTVEQNLSSLAAGGYLAQDAQGQAWRLTVRTRSIDPRRQGDVMERLQQQADAALAASPAGRVKATVQLTGIVPLVHASQSLLLRDLTTSFLTAFLIVGTVMVGATRSLRSGLIAMVPNLFPVVIVFGFLGWTGTAVDIGTMMTASVALGIAVDGTLHFLVTFDRENARLGNVEAAVQETLQRCGRAMGHATLICGVGLLVFCLSGFLPTQRFAIMIFTLLAAALIGDVVLFPALLIGPFERFYRTTEEASAGPADVEPTGIATKDTKVSDRSVKNVR